MLAACTPQPEPTPTKTALFTSDQEAFKAAEETYRAYNEAGNNHRRGGSDDPQDYLIGSALEGYIDGQRYLKKSGLTLEGDVKVASFVGDPSSFELDGRRIAATVCLDVTGTTTHSASGEELPERPPVLAQQVEMRWVADNYRISKESEGDASVCAE
jgi:hypothetical protein